MLLHRLIEWPGCPNRQSDGKLFDDSAATGSRFGNPPACPASLDDRPDFDGAEARAGDAGGDGDGFVEILGVDHEITAELLAGFGEWTVGDQALAVAHADAGGRRGGVQRSRI